MGLRERTVTVGAATAWTDGDGGRLYLGINDDSLQDNSGSLRVVIAY